MKKDYERKAEGYSLLQNWNGKARKRPVVKARYQPLAGAPVDKTVKI